MSRMKKLLGIAVLVGVVAALRISSVAAAQGSVTPTPTAPTQQAGLPGPGGFGARELRSQAALEAAAKALGMTVDELSAELWGGKTLADIAAEKGVDIADVKAAVEAAQIAETKTAIAQAVTDGTITQAKADWLIEGLDQGYWGAGAKGDFGFGMGPGMGHGGPRGSGGPALRGTPPNDTPPDNNGDGNDSTTPSGSTS
ncbi:hypothetical protein TFLX_01190 [Thermoflexales bacterium]|nr:hypothetical protein TFLX_01190 [Thermoflexales bacterium]